MRGGIGEIFEVGFREDGLADGGHGIRPMDPQHPQEIRHQSQHQNRHNVGPHILQRRLNKGINQIVKTIRRNTRQQIVEDRKEDHHEEDRQQHLKGTRHRRRHRSRHRDGHPWVARQAAKDFAGNQRDDNRHKQPLRAKIFGRQIGLAINDGIRRVHHKKGADRRQAAQEIVLLIADRHIARHQKGDQYRHNIDRTVHYRGENLLRLREVGEYRP